MQIQMESVESERREIPNKNSKKLMLMIHSRRLRGSMDSDTFFLYIAVYSQIWVY